MADAVIGAIVDVLLTKAISILEEQINLAWDFKDDLNKLRSSIALTHAFLQEAMSRQLDVPLKVWLEQLRGIASEADDVLDELAYEHLRMKVEVNQMKRKVRNFCSPSKNPITFTLKMAKKVKKIMKSMDDMNDHAAKYGLQQRIRNMATTSIGLGDRTHCFGDSSQVIGRDADVMKVADLLTSSTKPFSIVSIVGMAGMGKTTLAKVICNNERVRNRFNKIMWVCVAEKFDVQRILQEMVESLFGQTCELKNRNAILENINTGLEGKNYLLVLDDVWDVNFKKWEDLRVSLLGINEDNKGCSILVTTRNENVALVRETLPENRHHLKALEDDDCWSLIKERAFANSIPQELEVIGRDIARKCQGVPLVAAVIGGTMCNKRDKHEWMSIRDSSLWGSLERDEAILSVLKLSYDRLPSTPLKQCFVYCSIFPKDFCIQKEQLIQLWMAEGFLQQSEGNSMVVDEDNIGNEFFMNLLSSSLLQDVELDEYRCISTCKMHNLLHDLARSISEVQTSKIDSSYGSHIHKCASKVWHSLFLKMDADLVTVDFNGLRVLSFSDANMFSLPDSIGGLKHLRYFDISRTGISTIPKSLTKLYHLQTFRLLECYDLKKLPRGMKNLVSLRHLYITYSKQLTAEIGCLTNLKTLPVFDVGKKKGYGIGVLGNLSALGGKLFVSNLQNVRNKEEAREAKLWEKKKLHKLVYEWCREKRDENKDEEVLDGLEPHSSLKSLTIDGYKGGKYPSWIGGMGVCGSFSNLVELPLINCENLKSLPTLGQYLNLKFLRTHNLKKVRCIGNEFYHTSDHNKTVLLFPSLEVFSLRHMGKLEEWLEVEATITVPVLFPSLKHLEISHCPKLKSAPRMSRFSSLENLILTNCEMFRWPENGLFRFPSTLIKLTIICCSNLSCIPSVQGGISSLQVLRVRKCEKLSVIEDGLLASPVLRDVYISECPSLTSISFNGGFQYLAKLQLLNCAELREIEGGLQLQKLQEFTVVNCANLVSIPSMQGFSLLSELKIYGCNKLVSLPNGLQTCTSLEYLYVSNCSNLKSIPEERFVSLTNLKTLELGEFLNNLEEFPGISSTYSCVKYLTLKGWEKLSSLPCQLQYFTALEDLTIMRFHGMKALPEWLGNLSSLQDLMIDDCENLMQLPSKEAMQRLSNLQSVYITKCPQLKENNFERSKISHVPNNFVC